MSGSMSGMWKRGTVWIMRHRQTKGPDTDRPDLNNRATSRLYSLPGLVSGRVASVEYRNHPWLSLKPRKFVERSMDRTTHHSTTVFARWQAAGASRPSPYPIRLVNADLW